MSTSCTTQSSSFSPSVQAEINNFYRLGLQTFDPPQVQYFAYKIFAINAGAGGAIPGASAKVDSLKKRAETLAHKKTRLPSPLQHKRIAAAPVEAAPLVGFGNMSNNCWCNALLQMIISTPSLKAAYEAFAEHHLASPDDQIYAKALLTALEQYLKGCAHNHSLPTEVSQSVRIAFHHFFPEIASEHHRQEDAYEALSLLMGGYEKIMGERGSPLPSLYTQLETTRSYQPLEAPYALPPHANKASYSQLNAQQASLASNAEYQIFLDLQQQKQGSFSEQIERYFKSENPNSDPAVYLTEGNRLQKFKLICEERRFEKGPDELLVTVKRFGYVGSHPFKITTPADIERHFVLPPRATKENRGILYELDSFIVHSGSYAGGHYICYRLIGEKWYACNDANISEVSNDTVDQILRGTASNPHFTSYIHHYRKREGELPAAKPPPLSSSNYPYATEIRATDYLMEAYQKNRIDLQKLRELLVDPAQSPTTLISCLQKMQPELLHFIFYLVWLQDGMPQDWEYGKKAVLADPRILIRICMGWLLPNQKNLLDQLIAFEQFKLQCRMRHRNVLQAQQILALVDSGAVSSQEIRKLLSQLPVIPRDPTHLRELKDQFEREKERAIGTFEEAQVSAFSQLKNSGFVSTEQLQNMAQYLKLRPACRQRL